MNLASRHASVGTILNVVVMSLCDGVEFAYELEKECTTENSWR